MRWGRVVFAAVEVVLLAAVPALAWVGFQTVLDTTDGQAVDPELDPNEPGYEAFLEPTPVALAVGLDGDGALSWLTVLALGGPSEEGGAVLFVPPGTLVDVPDLGTVALADAWAAEGQASLVAAVGAVLGAGFDEVILLEPGRVAELVGPVSPLELVLSDELPGFDAGEVALDGPAVAELLEARAEGETDVNRLGRHEQVWRAWLVGVAASSDPDVVPGERASGIGRFVRGLAAGPVSYDVIPVSAVEFAVPDPDPDADEGDVVLIERFEADIEAVRSLVADRVPFPVASRPGDRLRVRVLDGVGLDGLALRAARDAVRAGGQVTVIGNADRFGEDSSRLVYFDASLADDADAMADALGISDVERADGPNPDDLVDATVVVGRDLADAYGLSGG